MAERLSAETLKGLRIFIDAMVGKEGMVPHVITLSLFKHIEAIEAENTRLQAEVERLKVERQEMLTAKRENKPND